MLNELAIYNRQGKAVFRLCNCKYFYDYQGRAIGHLVGRTVYDLNGQHRGFYYNHVVRDRTGKIIGYDEGACLRDVEFPFPDIPPVPYKNLAPPADLVGVSDLHCPSEPPIWSVMRLENLLVANGVESVAPA